jgi:hypothetical protein
MGGDGHTPKLAPGGLDRRSKPGGAIFIPPVHRLLALTTAGCTPWSDSTARHLTWA